MNVRTIESRALDYYGQYWENQEPFSKFDTRWEKMRDCFEDGDFDSLVRMWRTAMTEAYLAGFTQRITGE